MRPLRDLDAGERAQFLALLVRVGVPGLFLLILGEFLALARGWIGGWAFGLLLLLDLPLTYLLCRGIFVLVDRVARGFASTVYAGGGLAPDPAHSGIESLAARGLYREAEQAWRQWLAEHPADHGARLKLAELCRTSLDQPAEAERLYLEVRRGRPGPREEMLVTNLLIELYRATGRRDRLRVELARFADRYAGTRAGRDAARALRELKQDSPAAD